MSATALKASRHPAPIRFCSIKIGSSRFFKHLNNGEPSLHARCLSAVAPRPGERVLQVGAGGGYYTAILAELVGPQGNVEAREVEPAMIAAATRNFTGAARGMPAWLDALADRGRLISFR
jgi:protein-L-isoaspartate O-methyltransferase